MLAGKYRLLPQERQRSLLDTMIDASPLDSCNATGSQLVLHPVILKVDTQTLSSSSRIQIHAVPTLYIPIPTNTTLHNPISARETQHKSHTIHFNSLKAALAVNTYLTLHRTGTRTRTKKSNPITTTPLIKLLYRQHFPAHFSQTSPLLPDAQPFQRPVQDPCYLLLLIHFSQTTSSSSPRSRLS